MSNARKLADNLPTEGSLFGRNMVINGNMTIDQRNSGSAVTPTADQTVTLDRFKARLNNASKYSVQQVTDTPSGYYNSLKVTSAAATTVGTNDYYQIATPLEGYNVSQLDLGLSTAKKFTISFWVKSSLTGTFGGAYSNDQGDRFYAWTYTISSANTWEHKTVTVDGVTDGSWERTTGAGLHIYWTLGAGSGVQTTAGAWGTTFKRGPTGATNVVATNGATWQITGVQLEVGPQSTPFEHEPVGVTLSKCQRYHYKHFTETKNGQLVLSNDRASNRYYSHLNFPQEMRVAPTGSHVGMDRVHKPGITYDTIATGPFFYQASVNGVYIYVTSTSTHSTSSVALLGANSSGNIIMDAEL
tara:strand:- start:382 stop:1452 length:1071 start_codon:yes stop_codon:yes gene_type:complete